MITFSCTDICFGEVHVGHALGQRPLARIHAVICAKRAQIGGLQKISLLGLLTFGTHNTESFPRAALLMLDLSILPNLCQFSCLYSINLTSATFNNVQFLLSTSSTSEKFSFFLPVRHQRHPTAYLTLERDRGKIGIPAKTNKHFF